MSKKEVRNQTEAEVLQKSGEKLVEILKDKVTGSLVYVFDVKEVGQTEPAPVKSKK